MVLLAHIVDGSPYDYTKVLKTLWMKMSHRLFVKYAQRDIQDFTDTYIIVVSGREMLAEPRQNNGWRICVPYDEFYMRKSGDRRNDAIVKKRFTKSSLSPKIQRTLCFRWPWPCSQDVAWRGLESPTGGRRGLLMVGYTQTVHPDIHQGRQARGHWQLWEGTLKAVFMVLLSAWTEYPRWRKNSEDICYSESNRRPTRIMVLCYPQ